MLNMGVESGWVNQNVINVHDDKLSNHVSEDVIHEGLKDNWWVWQAKKHDLIFIVALVCAESSFHSSASQILI